MERYNVLFRRKSAFSMYHLVVNLIYIVFTLMITMITFEIILLVHHGLFQHLFGWLQIRKINLFLI